MTGPEHYAAAEHLIGLCEQTGTIKWVAENLAAAQAHATLALTAATVDASRGVTGRWLPVTS